MRTKFFLTTLLVFGLIFAFGQEPVAIPGQYIVELKESAAKPVVKEQKKNNNREQKAKDNQAAREKNMNKIKELKQKKNIKESAVLSEFADVVVGFSAKLTDEEVKNLKADPDVEGVYPDYVVALGPITEEPAPSDVNASAQYVGCNITKAGGFVNTSTKPTWIWILDTGINLGHPDLNVQTAAPYARSFVPGQTVEDGYGHGTHCAGIAAAKNNTIGVVGVSAGAKVVPVKVLDNGGSGAWSWIIAGLNHVATYDIPGDVVSMSLGGCCILNCMNSNPTLRNAVVNLGLAGTWVCMASGNNANDAGKNLPGCINGTRVFTVGCINCSNVCCSFSNFNPNVVDWVAVGYNVYSTYKNGGYTTMSGTSMSCPIVAGICHAKNAAPVSAGTVTCMGASYRIARR